jgi:hypothetical protein
VAQFASDTFTDTSGTALSTHSADWTLHTSYGTGACVISDANRVRRSNNNSALFWHAGSPASADYEVSADLFTKETDGGASNTGVVGRVDTTANTAYHARYGGSTTDGWQLFKIVGGTSTQLGSTSSQSLTDETTYAVKLKMVGTTIELFKEGSGSATISVTDSAISAAGKSGIRFVGTAETNTAGLHIDNFSADDVGGATHPSSGALASDAAVIAGTAAHLTLHTSTGALASDAAVIAGTATHLTLHTTTGALASDAATIAGDAEYTADGGVHATTGALASADAAIEGTAAHLTLHATTGALAADVATVAGTAAHLVLHTSTGALAAEAATVAGTAVHSGAGAEIPRNVGAGRARKAQRRRVIEVDGQDVIVGSTEEAQALFDHLRERATKAAAVAVDRAAKATRRPARKVLADARNALKPPVVTAPPDLAEMAAQALGDIRSTYRDAMASVEIAALLARRQREEEDDEDVLLLIA